MRRLMSAQGRVSRGSPVQTAMRNCTRDEGRSFEAGSQVLDLSAGKFDQAFPNIRLFRRLSDRRNMSDEKKTTPTPSEAESTANIDRCRSQT
jgi:hypothetical protein